MSVLLIDCETSGLIKRGLPLDSPEQPWIVSLAAQLVDAAGNELASLNTRIRAAGRPIAEDAKSVHGISAREAARGGVAEKSVLRLLCGSQSLASQARFVVGHGLQFDKDVITGSLMRNGWDASVWLRPGLQFCCTMLAGAPFCKLPSEHDSGGYKWPSLDAACSLLLGEEPRSEYHTAMDDLRRTRDLFFWLRERGAFEMDKAA